MDQKKKQQKGKSIEIELKEDEAPGTYSNLVMITHSPSEFVFDFISMMPAVPKAKVVKRIIMTPDHAKRLANALNENIRKYEAENGTISTVSKDKFDMPFNYRGPKPEA
ncbi:DUF3467 domain-containing protein [Rhodohalobacter sp.]|uniref:DUF3467 domain-containing protein n=1 Tax=Rhodohalobacter sp. TaxID=1974210 RepID=UPI002ACF0904|nr:DUF3467 domain-containing protein [Rhodohalobacter sp.]MDZ7757791.1 DUF3467 domain-containing protein [Rhodohalobacter sp.]